MDVSGFISTSPSRRATTTRRRPACTPGTKSLAANAGGPRVVRVNAVGADLHRYTSQPVRAIRSADALRVIAATPMGGRGGPDEIASVVLFLASDAASLMTGRWWWRWRLHAGEGSGRGRTMEPGAHSFLQLYRRIDACHCTFFWRARTRRRHIVHVGLASMVACRIRQRLRRRFVHARSVGYAFAPNARPTAELRVRSAPVVRAWHGVCHRVGTVTGHLP